MPKGVILTSEEQTARREMIVGVALGLVAEKGFQKTSMREIAEQAKMGKSSLYDFFKTKDEIVVYAVEKGIDEMMQRVQEIIREEPLPEQCIRKIMRNQLSIPTAKRTAMLWLNTESSYLEEEYQRRLKAARYAYQDIVKSVIDTGVATGVFRKTDTALMARLLLNSLLSIVYTSRPSDGQEQMLDETMNIFLHGILNK